MGNYILQNMLSLEGGAEGLFLVRESPTVDGAFILSCVQQGIHRHYQINRHGTDAFFSIGNISHIPSFPL